MVARESRTLRVLVAVCTISVAAVAAAYLSLIYSQGGPPPDNVWTVPFVAAYLIVSALLLAVSFVQAPRIVSLRPGLRAAAGAGLTVLAFLSFLEPALLVALLVLVAAAMTVVASRRRAAMLSAIVGAGLAIVVLIAGLAVTWQIIVCPPTGESGGTTVGLVTSSYAYECSDGVLTTHN